MKKNIQFIIINSYTKKHCFISKKKDFFKDLFKKNIRYYKIKRSTLNHNINKNRRYPLIVLIPTIHTSKKSSFFIERMFKLYFPTDIAIELCVDRYFNKKKVNNKKSYLLYKLLFNLQKQLSFNLNETFGIDIIKSIFLSKKYNCNLYLIDKKMKYILESLSKKISFFEFFFLINILFKLKYLNKYKLKLKFYYK